jgi:hypothetical protein
MSQVEKRQLGFEGKRVSVTLMARPGRGITTGLTNAMFDLACALG